MGLRESLMQSMHRCVDAIDALILYVVRPQAVVSLLVLCRQQVSASAHRPLAAGDRIVTTVSDRTNPRRLPPGALRVFLEHHVIVCYIRLSCLITIATALVVRRRALPSPIVCESLTMSLKRKVVDTVNSAEHTTF